MNPREADEVCLSASGVMLGNAAQHRVFKRASWPALLALALLVAVALFAPALAQTFPTLTGRVVDQANILKPEQRSAIEAKLKAHEDKTSDQVVVATVASLQGYEIEDYANRLFRAWKLGQAQKNNGVLLLVAPTERKVRIEVGYGLEGALTDALSGVIVRSAIAPKFKAGDFGGGIEAGIDAILSILAGDAEEWQRKPKIRPDETQPIDWVTILIFVVVMFLIVRVIAQGFGGASGTYRRRNGTWISVPGSSWSTGSSWSSGSSGSWSGGSSGGFAGGGGSSGGGGASGSW